MHDDFNPDELDPGIRRLVLWLRELGFETTDSGDGKTKFEQGWTEGCALAFPHVAIVCRPTEIIDGADKLLACLATAGITVTPEGTAGPTISATYDPADWSALLFLSNVSDADLPK